MNTSIIKSYLVQLGYEIDKPTLTKFNEALRQTAQVVTRFAGGMTKDVVEAGLAVTTALTGIAAGTVALMQSTARADLGYQLLARRMYMTVDAARDMAIATKELGFSIEDIVWGPPELRQRYQQLIQDQKALTAGLGGSAGFEGELRKIRDIEFEFTRLKVEAQYFVIGLTKSLSKALTGDENGILNKLREWNTWLVTNVPVLAQQFATYLAPVLRDTYAIFQDIADISRIVTSEFLRLIGVLADDQKLKTGAVSIDNIGRALDHVSHFVRIVFDELDRVAHFIDAHPWALRLFGAAAGAAVGSSIGAVVTLPFGGGGAIPGAIIGATVGGLAANDIANAKTGASSQGTSIDDIRAMIAQTAIRNGVDPAIALGVASVESKFDPNAQSPTSTAHGLFQLLQGTAKGLGVNAYDPAQNAYGGTQYLQQLYAKYGNWHDALQAYHDGPGAFDRHQPSTDPRYADKVLGAAQSGFDVGGIHITVNVNGTNAHPQDIGEHVAEAVHKELKKVAQRNIVQGRGSFQYA